MVQAWYMDSSDEDQRLPHQLTPNEPVSLEKLAAVGVLHWTIDAEDYLAGPETPAHEALDKICADRSYKNRDEITCTPEKLPNYEKMLKTFFQEHIHEDEEIRFVLDGTGYFDIRDKEDRWIRMAVSKNDLIILPAGAYHRFTLDSNDYVRAMRLFKDEPMWTPVNRPCDSNQFRLDYLKSLGNSA